LQVKVLWDGRDYYLAAMIEKSEWMNVDHLGEKGWEFVAFVPNHEVYISDSFSQGEKGELRFVRLAVFKREMMEESEGMDRDMTRDF
jgi:hypothetical protein